MRPWGKNVTVAHGSNPHRSGRTGIGRPTPHCLCARVVLHRLIRACSSIAEQQSALLTCSEDITASLLGCTKSEVFRKEEAGLLKHVPFWRDHGLASTKGGFFSDYWQNYDVRHYSVDQVLALMPGRSKIADHLKVLRRRNRDIVAGQVALASLPYLWVKISKKGAVSNAAPARRVSRSRNLAKAAELRSAK